LAAGRRRTLLLLLLLLLLLRRLSTRTRSWWWLKAFKMNRSKFCSRWRREVSSFGTKTILGKLDEANGNGKLLPIQS
jgi:hypothetical protein